LGDTKERGFMKSIRTSEGGNTGVMKYSVFMLTAPTGGNGESERERVRQQHLCEAETGASRLEKSRGRVQVKAEKGNKAG
jgi:hypothetical protein